jgi:hypothetical protein
LVRPWSIGARLVAFVINSLGEILINAPDYIRLLILQTDVVTDHQVAQRQAVD